jgi:hypothetical protein
MMYILTIIIVLLIILIPYVIGNTIYIKYDVDYNFIEAWLLGSAIIMLTISICMLFYYIGVMFLTELRVQLK